MTPKVDSGRAPSQVISPPTERVVAVVGLLGSQPARQFSLAEICRSLDISRATGHAILTTLAAHDWVTRDPTTAGYGWGPAIASLAQPANALMYGAELRALAAATGTQVYLTRREATTLVITETAGQCLTGPRIGPGMRTPLVAPFGRDYVAWSSSESQAAWLEAIGQPSPALRKRMSAVLREIRDRGFVVERLTREYVRVYTALRALSGDGEIDVITTQLARAFADLAVIDILPAELAGNTSVATVSAPIFDVDGAVTMSVTAGVFTTLDGDAIYSLGEQVRQSAARIEQHIARYGNFATI